MSRFADYMFEHLRVVYLSLLLFCIFAISVLLYLGYHLNNENKERAQEAIVLSLRIQNEREANIEVSCLDQNSRNMNTLEALDLIYDGIAAKIKKDSTISPAVLEEQLKVLREGQSRTTFIINSLAPVHEDCKAYARSQVTVGKTG